MFYPALTGTVRLPPKNSANAEGVGGRSTARKSPIGEG
ncbi:spermidine/putrescine ABC transporter ATP-binding protein [Bacillus cereus group sp. RP32]